MKHIFLFAMLLLLPLTMVGQTDSLETEIMNYSPSQSDLISKGRRLLLDAFVAEDYDKVREVKDYLLTEVQSEDYLVFYPGEYWLLLYWTQEFGELLGSLEPIEENPLFDYSTRIRPAEDLLFVKLQEESRKWKDRLYLEVWRAPLTEEEKGLLKINLNYLIAEHSEPEVQESLNQQADDFLMAHPESEYEDFVRQNLRYVYRPGNWGLGFEFFSGYGGFTGELGDAFSGHVPLGIAFDLEYKKFTLYLRNYIGIGKTSEDIPFHNDDQWVWEKDNTTNIYLPEASIGYAVVENERIKFSPYAGIGGANISAPEADLEKFPDLENAAQGWNTTYTVGATLDFKLGWYTGEYIPSDQTYWFVRLRYGYSMPCFEVYPGNIHFLSIGFGGKVRGMKRDL